MPKLRTRVLYACFDSASLFLGFSVAPGIDQPKASHLHALDAFEASLARAYGSNGAATLSMQDGVLHCAVTNPKLEQAEARADEATQAKFDRIKRMPWCDHCALALTNEQVLAGQELCVVCSGLANA